MGCDGEMRMMIRLLLIVAAMASMTLPAEAEDCADYGLRAKSYRSCDVFGHCIYRQLCVRHDAPRVYGYSRREDDDRPERRDQCLAHDVDVLSTEHQSEDNAREAARKLWMAKTQWSHGGQYMDLDEAAHIRWRCGPSNAHDTASGRIAEAAKVSEVAVIQALRKDKAKADARDAPAAGTGG